MLENILLPMESFFKSGNTKSFEFRIKQLQKLKNSITENESQILRSLSMDLGKSEFEAYTSEIGIVYQEIDFAIKNLKKWMKPKKVKTPIYLQPGISKVYPEPKGIVLIISPWNYPFQLILSPLVGAIAAGNCTVIKPSQQSKEVSKVVENIIEETFPSEYIATIQGPGSEVVDGLIKNFRFDHIFFTGSAKVGKHILSLAADKLIPVTLELGGKSPTIVHKDANIDIAAKRIAWAKFYNAGQTCVAPDYLLVEESIKKQLIEKIKYYINLYYGDNPMESKDFGRIINEKRLNRLIHLLKDVNIIQGGNYFHKDRYMSPTLVEVMNIDSPIMKEEIFGPILPVLKYNKISELFPIINKNPYPLALYLFTKDKSLENFIISNIQFGGGCINHLISQVANPHLPFGGIGYSGMGRYHSKASFDTFSHEKSIYKSKTNLDTNILYPPYTKKILKFVKKFFEGF